MPDARVEKFRGWFEKKKGLLLDLESKVVETLRANLKVSKIPVVGIESRVKDIRSACEKISEKDYETPQAEITDLVGIRVITNTGKDAALVCAMIKEIFKVDRENSVDKAASLKQDRVGYRSVHLVCSWTDERLRLRENSDFSGHVFEIQVRTALQHAWAVFEHSRRYKLESGLPSTLDRRINLVSALLEVADGQLDELATKFEEYVEETERKTRAGRFDLEVTPVSLTSFAKELAKKLPVVMIGSEISDSGKGVGLVDECKAMGIDNIAILNGMLTPAVLKGLRTLATSTHAGLIRRIMMLSDLEGYIVKTRGVRSFKNLSPSTIEALAATRKKESVLRLLKLHQINISAQ